MRVLRLTAQERVSSYRQPVPTSSPYMHGSANVHQHPPCSSSEPPGHVGVELHLLTGQMLGSTGPAAAGVVHAVGGRRLRLLRSSCARPGEPWRQVRFA